MRSRYLVMGAYRVIVPLLVTLFANCAALPPVAPTPLVTLASPRPTLPKTCEETAAVLFHQAKTAHRLRVAVMEVTPLAEALPDGYAAAIASFVENGWVAAGGKVVDRAQIERVLGELRLTQSALFDRKSALQIGKLVGVDAVVTGSLYTVPEGYERRLILRLISVETGAVLAATTRTLARASEFQTAIVRAPGAIRLEGYRGALLSVDDQPYTRADESTIYPVAYGSHKLRLKSDGLFSVSRVWVSEGQTVTVNSEIEEGAGVRWRNVAINATLPGLSFVDHGGDWVKWTSLGFYVSGAAFLGGQSKQKDPERKTEWDSREKKCDG